MDCSILKFIFLQLSFYAQIKINAITQYVTIHVSIARMKCLELCVEYTFCSNFIPTLEIFSFVATLSSGSNYTFGLCNIMLKNFMP